MKFHHQLSNCSPANQPMSLYRKLAAALVSAALLSAASLLVFQSSDNTKATSAPSGITQNQASKKSSTHCSPYSTSTLYRPRSNSLTLTPADNWVHEIEHASQDTEILLADGIYDLLQYSVLLKDDITLRSESGNSDAVLIRGPGYDTPNEGLIITGNNITIADLSMTGMRDHAISAKPEIAGGDAPHIYNVDLYNIGTQHIKGSPGTSNGLIACSAIGYKPNGAKGDYNGAIDLHTASNWTIRDNTIYNIAGDGSGCNVDKECGSYLTGPAILIWNNSKDTTVERNTITDSTRNIAFGLGRGHEGGIIRENHIVQTTPGDAGIELQSATGTIVENNVVLLKGNYRGAIEFRETRDIVVRSNTITSPPWDRGDNLRQDVHSNTIVKHPDSDKPDTTD